jgi:hypothetical protein
MVDEAADDVGRPPAGGLWRVTCSCRERIGYAASLAEAEALERDHVAVWPKTRRHVITIARK